MTDSESPVGSPRGGGAPTVLLVVLGGGALAASPFADWTPEVGGGFSLVGFGLYLCGLACWTVAALRTRGRRAAWVAGAYVLAQGAWLAGLHPHWLAVPRVRDVTTALFGSEAERSNTVGWHPYDAAAAFGLLALVGGGLLWWARRDLWRWGRTVSRVFGTGALLLGLVVWVVSSAHGTPYVQFGGASRMAVDVAIALGATALGVLAWIAFGAWLRKDRLPRTRWLDPSRDGEVSGDGAGDSRFVGGVALGVLMVTGAIAYGVFERMEHIPDGVAYIFQARTFAAGQLWFPAPPVPEAFDTYLLEVQGDRWFAVTPPGWPAVLALGVWLGAPWLVNPALAAATILLLGGALRRRWGSGVSRRVVLLLACSPWFLFLSASHMTHAVTLFDVVLATWCVVRFLEGGRLRWLPLAGAALGHAFLTRPLDGLLLGFVVGGGLFLWTWRWASPGRAVRVAAAFSVGAVAVGGWVFPYNHALTGDAFKPPIQSYIDRIWYPGANDLGFGPEVGNPPMRWGNLDPYPGHGWRDVVWNTQQNLVNLDDELCGVLPPILVLAVLGVLRGRLGVERGLGVVLLLLAAGYSLYWFSGGPDFGARYWYAMVVPLLLLVASGHGVVVERLRAMGMADAGPRCAAVLLLAVFAALAVHGPFRIVSRYVGYRGFHSGFEDLRADPALADALVLVPAPPEGVPAMHDVVFASAQWSNDPRLPPGRPVFAHGVTPEVEAALRRAFPDRKVFWAEPGLREVRLQR